MTATETISIKQTKTSPLVYFDSLGDIILLGYSVMDNAEEFYDSVRDWLKVYEKKPAQITTVQIYYSKMNQWSENILLDCFRLFQKLHRNHKTVEITWEYSTQRGKEMAELLHALFKVPVKMVFKKA